LLGGGLCIGNHFLTRLKLGLENRAMTARLNHHVVRLVPIIHLRFDPCEGRLNFFKVLGFRHTPTIMKTPDRHCPTLRLRAEASRTNPRGKADTSGANSRALGLSVLMLTLMLAGCGQKGPLFLPKPQFPAGGEATQSQEAR
jgi:predicted small lipoprotein YifL